MDAEVSVFQSSCAFILYSELLDYQGVNRFSNSDMMPFAILICAGLVIKICFMKHLRWRYLHIFYVQTQFVPPFFKRCHKLIFLFKVIIITLPKLTITQKKRGQKTLRETKLDAQHILKTPVFRCGGFTWTCLYWHLLAAHKRSRWVLSALVSVGVFLPLMNVRPSEGASGLI